MSDEYAFSDAEVEQLARAFESVSREIAASHFAQRPLNAALLESLHRGLFHGVRPHCGRMRSATWGYERVVVFEAPSEERRLVEECVRRVLDRARALRSDQSLGTLYDELGWMCAELIRIQPFIDGNKRTTALFVSELARRLELAPLDFTRMRDRFLDAARAHVRNEDRSGRPMGKVLALVSQATSDE